MYFKVSCGLVLHLIVILVYDFRNLVASDKCNSFQDIFVSFVDQDAVKFNQTINGCIERVKFNGKTIVEAYIRNQHIKTLGRDSVRNVIHLSTISFWDCGTKEILPGAFRNVLELKNIQISYNALNEVPKGKYIIFVYKSFKCVNDVSKIFNSDGGYKEYSYQN